MGVDLEESSSGEEEKDQEEYGMGEGVRMLLPPPPAHSEEGAWGARRGPAACLAWGAGLVLWNVGVATACLLVLAAVFALVLLPVTLLLYAGFLCHSRVRKPLTTPPSLATPPACPRGSAHHSTWPLTHDSAWQKVTVLCLRVFTLAFCA